MNWTGVRVFVCNEPTDMRVSFDRLSHLARSIVKEDPLSGHLFLFISRDRGAVKILYWDRSGYAIWYKKLQGGRFFYPSKRELSYTELMCVLDGIEFEKMVKKSRFCKDNISPCTNECVT